MFTCVIDPFGCLSDGIGQMIASIAWYWWALAGLVLVGIVWKLAGWPGLLALAAGAGFILGRRSAPDPIEHVEGKDAAPPVHRPRVKPKRTLNTDTGMWE